MGLLHTLAHWLKINTGQVVSRTDELGRVWVGYQCTRCGLIQGRHCVDKMIDRDIEKALSGQGGE